ncbi:sigma-54-dependent Fis family transcriptional regulator [Bacillus sp. Marseille-Q3570]|uniref:sigma-54 interaction domain-containing protein n=1 Tax=Bacillus sp. Marseille-Q3570 TaxID=2963522 RepID=UPI0021B763E5|nr:sigma 54-interacting transcriptional regulator [Bacillus sp. Marseille-Q3570]
MLRNQPTMEYKLVLDHMHEGVIIIDSETRVLYANKSYYEILGISVDSIHNKPLKESQPNARIIKVLETGTPVINSEFLVDTTSIRVVANIIPIKIDGEISGAVSVFRDVTEVTELTTELERLKGYTKYLEEELMSHKERKLFNGLVGSDQKIQMVMEKINKVARTDTTVLITGESGTGKEVVANSIYNISSRFGKPFIKVNCAAIPESLLESEFFGYEEGAFTGSKKGGKIGKFELANTGTIFLDEIGEMPPSLQAKLLRVLQERVIEKIGGTSSIRIDVRIIAATNANLKDLVEKRKFREDLYYRLNVFPIDLPPLKERQTDILPLAIQFLKEFCNEHKKQLSFSAEVQHVFKSYQWPGNIRELKNVIEYAVIMCEKSGRITLDLLPDYLNSSNQMTNNMETDNILLYKQFEQIEEQAIREALIKTKGHRSDAIKLLGLSRKKFYKKINEYGIF